MMKSPNWYEWAEHNDYTEFVPAELQGIPECKSRQELFDIAAAMSKDGLPWAEFGVMSGRSAVMLLSVMPPGNTMYLCDSWMGLPSEWSYLSKNDFPKGSFKRPKPIINDNRIVWVDGWFKDTIGDLCGMAKRQFGLVHIDCDLYESCKTVLLGLGKLIGPGTILIFDEFHGFPFYQDGEYKAFHEWASQTEQKYQYIAMDMNRAVVSIN